MPRMDVTGASFLGVVNISVQGSNAVNFAEQNVGEDVVAAYWFLVTRVKWENWRRLEPLM